jgi:hypothetical protein
LTGEPLDWTDSQVTEIALLVCNVRTMANSLTHKFQELQQALAYEALLKRITMPDLRHLGFKPGTHSPARMGFSNCRLFPGTNWQPSTGFAG